MNYRQLGKTGLRVSEIGLGGEWLERHSTSEVKAVIDRCDALGINILDCWMCNPQVRSDIGAAIAPRRGRWIIQGHLGSTWQNGQYVKTRDLEQVKIAFQDLLNRLQTDYIDLGMIHFVDDTEEFASILNSPYMAYIRALKQAGTIRHIGLSTHNPAVGKLAALAGEIEMILFSVNPAFDMLPANQELMSMFEADAYQSDTLAGIDPARSELYRICEQQGVGITVMKGYGGGRLFQAEFSPFGVALTPVQCIHYALTRPAVAAIMTGCETVEQVDEAVSYETAAADKRDYATVLAGAPRHAFSGQCTYCGHCAPCPNRIDIAMVNKLTDLAAMQPQVPATLRAHYQSLPANAGDCIACHACEARCPFGVEITSRMAQARALFE